MILSAFEKSSIGQIFESILNILGIMIQ